MGLWITPDWPAPDNIQAICTTSKFGNLALHAGLSHSHSELNNRSKLSELFNLTSQPAWLNQTHTNCVINLEKKVIPETTSASTFDASYTRLTGQAAVVLTADCLPILLCDKRGDQVAAIHAGWRGLANGIIANTIQLFTQPQEVLVWLGPAIGPQAFEVGKEVVDIFLALNLDNQQAITPITSVTPVKVNKYFVDIYKLAKIQLANLGVSNLYGGEYCTYTQADLFYSYRRDKQSGRMASMIWKKNKV